MLIMQNIVIIKAENIYTYLCCIFGAIIMCMNQALDVQDINVSGCLLHKYTSYSLVPILATRGLRELSSISRFLSFTSYNNHTKFHAFKQKCMILPILIG